MRTISRVSHRDARDAVRAAIASFEAEAVGALRVALRDGGLARPVRVHIPNTLTRIGTKEAVELALEVDEEVVVPFSMRQPARAALSAAF